jgi:rhodanese-related sulfurtransferase
MAISEISVDQLADAIEQPGSTALLIDVREVDEYVDGHVSGAVLVPLGTVPDNVDAFRGEGTTYVICKSGGRSMRACEFLADHGIDAVNVAGGTMGWMASGREVVSGDRPS